MTQSTPHPWPVWSYGQFDLTTQMRTILPVSLFKSSLIRWPKRKSDHLSIWLYGQFDVMTQMQTRPTASLTTRPVWLDAFLFVSTDGSVRWHQLWQCIAELAFLDFFQDTLRKVSRLNDKMTDKSWSSSKYQNFEEHQFDIYVYVF